MGLPQDSWRELSAFEITAARARIKANTLGLVTLESGVKLPAVVVYSALGVEILVEREMMISFLAM